MTHTPTPWRLDEGYCASFLYSGKDCLGMISKGDFHRPDDIQFIVTACNSYDALLAACESALKYFQEHNAAYDPEHKDLVIQLETAIQQTRGK